MTLNLTIIIVDKSVKETVLKKYHYNTSAASVHTFDKIQEEVNKLPVIYKWQLYALGLSPYISALSLSYIDYCVTVSIDIHLIRYSI